MLHVHPHCQNQPAQRHGVFGVIQRARRQLVALRAVAQHLKRQPLAGVNKGNHRRNVAGFLFVFGGEPFFHQLGKHRAGEGTVQLVQVKARRAVKRGCGLPPAALNVAVFLHVVPHAAAMRANVVGGFRQKLAEYGMVAVRVLVALQVVKIEHMGFAALVARDHAHALVAQFHFGFNGAHPCHRRRAANYDFRLGKGFGALFCQFDAVALAAQV